MARRLSTGKPFYIDAIVVMCYSVTRVLCIKRQERRSVMVAEMVTDWFSGAIIWRIDEDGDLVFLVQDSDDRYRRRKTWRIKTRFMGGKSKDHPEDKSPLATLRRELREEAGLEIEHGLIPQMVYSPNPEDDHQKFFFLVPFSWLVGELRTTCLQDDNSFLFPPRWASATGISLFGKHRKAARAAVKRIRNPQLQFVA